MTVKAATLIFISGRGSAINEGNQGLFIIWLKQIISCLSAQTCVYFTKIVTVITLNSQLFTHKAHNTKNRMVLSSVEIS